MEDLPQHERGGIGGGWIAAIVAVIAAVLGVVGFKAGWFDQFLSNEKKKDTPEKKDPAVSASGGEAREADRKKFETVAMAAHQHYDAAAAFPTNVYDAAGKPLLSWRVALLPQLGHEELYKKFKLDEPWDSEHNKKLIASMPEIFAMEGQKAAEGATSMQAFESKKNASSRSFLMEGERKGLPIPVISDGTSNTAMFVESANPVTWTKPHDIPFSQDGPLPALGLPNQGFIMAMTDGSVALKPSTIDPAVIRAYATVNGNEVFQDDTVVRPLDTPAKPPVSQRKRQ